MFVRLPKFGAWLNALGLALVTALVATAVNYISRETKLFEVLPVQWDLLVACLLMLSPIWAIAYTHHFFNLVLEASLSDAQRAEHDRLTGIFPTLVSWWEGLYAWMAINIATITCIAIGGLFIPVNNRSYNVWGFLSYIYEMLIDVNKFKYVLSGPFILWMISAAYLYEFQSHIQRYFVRRDND